MSTYGGRVLSEKKNGVWQQVLIRTTRTDLRGKLFKNIKNAMKALTNKVKSAYSMAKRFVKSCKKGVEQTEYVDLGVGG